MKNEITILTILYVAALATAALLVLVCETGLIETGQLAGDAVAAYWMGIAGVALTILCLPLALKLMKFKRVRQEIAQCETAYLRWFILRIALLSMSLLYNLISYYLLGCEPTCGYLALMTVMAFLFVWPSKDKMRYERELTYPKEEP